jgi:plastocyanin
MSRRARRAVTLGVAACALAPAAAGGHPGHANQTVVVADTSYTPSAIDVTEGDVVDWRWNGPDTNHSVTADAGQAEQFDSDKGKGALAVEHRIGETFTYYFGKPGTYAYHCKVHSSMRGTVVVSPAARTDQAAPRISRVRARIRGKRVRFSFRADEPVSVLAKVRRRGATRVARSSFQFAGAGAAHVGMKLAGLARGRYAATLHFEDDSGNAAADVVVRFRY